MKLVYTLTKPADVTRRRVLELLEFAKVREGKKVSSIKILPYVGKGRPNLKFFIFFSIHINK